MTNEKKISVGSTIVMIGYLGLFPVSFILASGADLNSALGRHLLAGALANASFSVAQIAIAGFALRRGEKWAWWLNFIPAIGYGLTILLVDATHVQASRLFLTLLPQVCGLVVLGTGLFISGVGIFRR